MRESTANLVYPVLEYGLRLRERLDRGEKPDLDQEQATLKGLLGGGQPGAAWAQAGGPLMEADARDSGRAAPRPAFHYALVCWLDEVFSDHPAWADAWTEHILEFALYSTRDRAWKFPEQAHRALNRPGADDAEVFYLCVMLGFRGDWRDRPADLRAWVDAAEARLAHGRAEDWPGRPTDLEAPGAAPPRRARRRLQRMLSVAVAAALLLIPAVTFYLVLQLGK